MTSCSWTQPTIANSSARWAWTKIALFAKPLWMYLPSSFAPFYAFLQSIIWFTYFIAVMINIIEVKITTSLAVSRLNWGKWHFTLSDSLWSEQIKAGRLSRVLTLSRTSWNQSKSECWVCPSHPASHVTLWMSGGKFASRLNFKGRRFFFLRGALLLLQGGTFFPDEKCQN